jgi:hypothetical protein
MDDEDLGCFRWRRELPWVLYFILQLIDVSIFLLMSSLSMIYLQKIHSNVHAKVLQSTVHEILSCNNKLHII